MSFILDALKKSESDRQRQGGPALFEVKVARAHTRWPLWALGIGALLALNLGLVSWMLVRHSARGDGSPTAPASTAAGISAAAAPPPSAAPLGANTSAVSAPAGAAPPAAAGPQQPPAPAGIAEAAAPVAEPNAADYAPAAEPAAASSHVRRTTVEGVPLYQDAAATPGSQLPQLRLDLHVFAARPEERFVMINMHKLREGDSLPDGVHVDSITPDGAVLSYNGSRFLLPRD